MQLYPGRLDGWGVSPNAWTTRNGYSGPISGVIHAFSSSANARQTFNWFMQRSAGATSTMIVGKDGSVFQCCDPQVAHAANCCPSNSGVNYFPGGNANNWTWAVEFEKGPGNTDSITEAQMVEGMKVVDWLCKVCGTPRKWINGHDGGILTHSFLDPVHRPGGMCPGPFDFNRLFNYLQGGGNGTMGGKITLDYPEVAALFSATPGGWLVKGKKDRRDGSPIILHGAILDHYCTIASAEPGFNGLTLYGLPTTNEYKDGNGVKMEFERAHLKYEPGHKDDSPPGAGSVYTCHIEGLLTERDALKSQVATLGASLTKSNGLLSAANTQIATLQAEAASLREQVTSDVMHQTVVSIGDLVSNALKGGTKA